MSDESDKMKIISLKVTIKTLEDELQMLSRELYDVREDLRKMSSNPLFEKAVDVPVQVQVQLP